MLSTNCYIFKIQKLSRNIYNFRVDLYKSLNFDPVVTGAGNNYYSNMFSKL